MLLAVDIGNSNIKFGVYDGDRLISKYSIPTDRTATARELNQAIGKEIDQSISYAIVCSVVPEIEASIREFLLSELNVEPVFVANDFDFGLSIIYEPLSSIGTDRLVNAFSAAEKYGDHCIVCSFGTALTIDVIDADRNFAGGLIAPGMATMLKSLNLHASKLPEVPIEKPLSVIQNTTAGSIQSGIVYGYFALADGLLSAIKNEIGNIPRVIATGGFAQMISENIRQIDIVDENLLLDGLEKLHRRLTATVY